MFQSCKLCLKFLNTFLYIQKKKRDLTKPIIQYTNTYKIQNANNKTKRLKQSFHKKKIIIHNKN